jgi:hypothetical protein
VEELAHDTRNTYWREHHPSGHPHGHDHHAGGHAAHAGVYRRRFWVGLIQSKPAAGGVGDRVDLKPDAQPAHDHGS